MIKQSLLPKGHRVRPGKPLTLKYITIHSTGNPSSSANSERRWLDNPDNKRDASWHICIDEKEAIMAIPLNEQAWHAGDATGNSTSIGIEICESGNRQKTLDHAAKVVAELLFEFHLTTANLKRHYDWSKKSCPSILMSNNWSGWYAFVSSVEKELKALTTPSTPKWQIDALESLCERKGLDKTHWQNRIEDNITVGELFGILNKLL